MYPCTTGTMCVKEAAKFSIRFLVFNQNKTTQVCLCFALTYAYLQV
jgi:hypothetical protein